MWWGSLRMLVEQWLRGKKGGGLTGCWVDGWSVWCSRDGTRFGVDAVDVLATWHNAVFADVSFAI
jgi:hypothetical protein